ncbi:MAG: histidinol-phosphatase [Firmicutes bacterium]|nr:histidinol-phosphatase [Bacillota bacterium]MDD4262903.1 histidinol-phosphatase [Bacillota bacterium]MDD4693048.1 histidinol-phosphatase [Bacillota bacterium]
MLVDYHMHLENGPKTLDYVEQFLKVAKRRGISEIGFSEHCYRFKEARHLLDNAWARERNVDSLKEYLELLNRAKQKGWPIKIGIEVDYLPEAEGRIREFLKEYEFDYVFGSVHWLDDFGFDLKENLSVWEQSDVTQVWKDYFETLLKAAESGLFDSLPHPDLIKIYNFYPKEDLNSFIAEIFREIAKTGVALEASTAGWRKPIGEMYPSTDILELIKVHNIPITLASDAHFPEDVGKDFDRMIPILQKAGIEEFLRFNKHQRSKERF